MQLQFKNSKSSLLHDSVSSSRATSTKGSATKKSRIGFALCLIAVTVIAAPVNASADYNPVPLTVRGESGVWFERSEAEHLLYQVEQRIPNLEAALDLSTDLNASLRDQVATSSATIQLVSDIAKTERERGDHWHDAYMAELDRSNSLWNDTMFWLVVGLVAGGGIAGGTAYMATR